MIFHFIKSLGYVAFCYGGCRWTKLANYFALIQYHKYRNQYYHCWRKLESVFFGKMGLFGVIYNKNIQYVTAKILSYI